MTKIVSCQSFPSTENATTLKPGQHLQMHHSISSSEFDYVDGFIFFVVWFYFGFDIVVDYAAKFVIQLVDFDVNYCLLGLICAIMLLILM